MTKTELWEAEMKISFKIKIPVEHSIGALRHFKFAWYYSGTQTASANHQNLQNARAASSKQVILP